MNKARLFHDKPQTIRMATADAKWVEEEGTRRGCARAVILRGPIADARGCSSLPASLRAQILAAARREGLSFRDYVSELLRAEAQRIMAGGRGRGSGARAAPRRTVALVNAENPMASCAPPAPSRRVLCGGDYHHRVRDSLVTVLDVEVRHGRATGRLLVVETTAAIRVPFVCHQGDLVVPAASPPASAPEDTAPAAAERRPGRRRP